MTRVAIALLAGMVAVASVPVEAATTRRTAKTSAETQRAKKRAAKKKAAKKRAAKKKAAENKRKKLARGKGKRRGKTVAAVEKFDPKQEGMPKGFDWPPSAPMKAASAACEKQLDALGIRWERATAEGRIVDPIVVPSMEIAGVKYVSAYKRPPHRMDCQLVQALAAVGPALVTLGVREVKFGSIYRNTNVRAHGATKPILSRHALGLAMDIKSFVDAQGREVSVELDYLPGDTLLHGIEDAINASQKFRAVLTPGNDPISHYDHFHIEATVDFTAFR